MAVNTSNGEWTNVSQNGSSEFETAWSPLTTTSGFNTNSNVRGTYTAEFDTPDWLGDVPVGSEFVSLRVRIDSWSTSSSREARAKLNEGSVTQSQTQPTVQTRWTLNGDAAYWGLTDDPVTIINKIRDGTIQFEYWCPDFETSGDYEYANLDVRLTYDPPKSTARMPSIF